MAHTNEIKTVMGITQEKVMQLLGWDDLQYAEYQEKQGYEYLFIWLQGDEVATAEHSKSATYWAWWRNHWQKRDHNFLLNAGCLTDSGDRVAMYRLMHNPERIEFTPHRNVLERINKINPVADEMTTKLRELDELLQLTQIKADEILQLKERKVK